MDDALFRYMFRFRSWNEMAAWARQLEVLRFVRGPGGHDVTPDRFVALAELPPGGFSELLAKIGASEALLRSSPDALSAALSGVEVSLTRQERRVEIVVWAPGKNPYEWTEDDFRSALAVDEHLRRAGLTYVDPPHDSEYCICPKHYPEMWENGAPDAQPA